jgi:hypothetical protein
MSAPESGIHTLASSGPRAPRIARDFGAARRVRLCYRKSSFTLGERMANDHTNHPHDEHVKSHEQTEQSGRKRVIGEGMNSLDSTQVPLKAENAEPDWDAVNGRVPKGDKNGED